MTAAVAPVRAPGRAIPFLRRNASITLIYLLIIVVAIGASMGSSTFGTPTNLLNIARQSIVLGLIAIGQTVVALTGGMDMSVAMIARLVALVVASAFAATGSDPVMILPLVAGGILLGSMVGLMTGTLVTRTHANPFIITFGVGSALRGIDLAISSTPIRGVPTEYLAVYDSKIGIVPICVLAMALVWVMGWVFLTRTALGRAIYAAGGSERVARLSGIRVDRTVVFAYVFSAACAAAAGLFMLSRSGVGDPSAAEGMEFQSVVAVALGGVSLYGGKGSLIGTLGGVLLISMLSNVFNLLRVDIFYQQLLLGLIVLVAVAAYKSPRAQ